MSRNHNLARANHFQDFLRNGDFEPFKEGSMQRIMGSREDIFTAVQMYRLVLYQHAGPNKSVTQL